MSGLRVLSGGLNSTIQDRGRFCYQDLGVPVAGMLDSVALRLANALVGNPGDVAGLEIYLLGPSLAVECQSLRLAVCGPVRLTLSRNGQSSVLATDRSHLLHRGDVLAVGAVVGASVAVLAVEGGFALEPVMGSLSTYTRSCLGPLGGKALAEGMVIPLRRQRAAARCERALASPYSYESGPVRVMLGPQDDHFTEAAVAAFLAEEYRIGQNADRMGLRLEGPALTHRGEAGIPSEGLVSGSIQVPGNGQPILLLADHQTVGGYAKIATVISADLARVGRAVAGTALRFRCVTQAEAEAARRDLEQSLGVALAAMEDLAAGLDLTALYSANLVSGVVSGDE